MNQNQIKKLSSLLHAKYRKMYGLFLAEGIHIVKELLKSNWEPQLLVMTHEAVDSGEYTAIMETASRKGVAVETVTQKELSRLSTTEAPQGIMAIVRLPHEATEKLVAQKRILVADGISDPGNLGTMVRTAAAFGFGGFVTTPGSADIYNPKTVRATQGAMFHLAMANHLEPKEFISKIKPTHKIYALSAHGRNNLSEARPAAKSVLIVGAEITGVSKEFLDIADQILRIPMPGPIESLNAAVAAGIAMYDFSHRKM